MMEFIIDIHVLKMRGVILIRAIHLQIPSRTKLSSQKLLPLLSVIYTCTLTAGSSGLRHLADHDLAIVMSGEMP